MKIVFYQIKCKPEIIDVKESELSGLVGGHMDIEEMICDTCVVWWKNAPIRKDRTSYYRNVFITKYEDETIKCIPTQIFSNFFLCGYKDGQLTDIPHENLKEIMAMFGF